jgi:hypothetical protein
LKKITSLLNLENKWKLSCINIFLFFLLFFFYWDPCPSFSFAFASSLFFLAASLLHSNIYMRGMMIKTWSNYKGFWLAEKGILWGIFLVFTINVRVEHFWWI